MLYLSLLLTLIAIFLWKDTVHNKFFSLKIAALVFISFFISGFYYVSDHLTGNGIDESVLFHLTVEMTGAGFSEFANIIVFSIVYIIVSTVISIAVYKIVLTDYKLKRHKFQVALATTAIVIAFYINPGVTDITRLYSAVAASSQDDKRPNEYLLPSTTQLSLNNKNIVYLYLESVERTFQDETLFPGLTPNLQRLEKESLVFTDMRQVYGSGWTIAGMVNSQCGIPLITPSQGNSMSGTDQFLPEALCLGDILNKNGYNLNYLGGASLDFAGKGNFYKTHGFSRVEGFDELIRKLEDPAYRSNWGLYDDSLLDIAKSRYDDLITKAVPFGLFALTLDTHHPNGHMAKYCSGLKYQDGSNPILNAVHCADKMTADFVKHIRSSDGYENTIVVVSSDHLAMRNTAWDQLKQGDRKNLLMVLGKDIPPKKIEEPGALIDVAPTLLGILGADIDGLGFGRNMLLNKPSLTASSEDVSTMLSTHRGFVSSLWSFPQIKDGLIADFKKNKIHLGGRTLSYPAIIVLNEDLSVHEVRFEFYSPEKLTDQIKKLSFDQRFIWIDQCQKVSALSITHEQAAESDLCISMGAMGANNISVAALSAGTELPYKEIKQFFNTLNYDEDISIQRLAAIDFFNKHGAIPPPLPKPENDLTDKYIIVSAGGFTGPTLIDNLDKSMPVSATRGLTLFGLNSDSPAIQIKNLDTCGASVETLTDNNYSFQDDINRLSFMFGAFIITAHDSATCGNRDLSTLFARTGLSKWKNIGFRTPYIGVIAGNGATREFTGKSENKITIEAQDFIRPRKQPKYHISAPTPRHDG